MNKFLTITLAVFLACLINGCSSNSVKSTTNAPRYATETRGEFGFREIKAGNSVILIVTVGEPYGITVEGEEQFIKDVKTETQNETLIITTRGKITRDNKIRLKISTPELKGLELWGASEASVTNVNSESLKLNIGGTSSLKIDGKTASLNASATGDSRIEGESLQTEKTEAKAAGTSEITVSVTSELIAEALGASTVYYLGEPKNIKPSIAGSGEVRKK